MIMALVRTPFVERNLHFILRIVGFIIRIFGKRNFKSIRDPLCAQGLLLVSLCSAQFPYSWLIFHSFNFWNILNINGDLINDSDFTDVIVLPDLLQIFFVRKKKVKFKDCGGAFSSSPSLPRDSHCVQVCVNHFFAYFILCSWWNYKHT